MNDKSRIRDADGDESEALKSRDVQERSRFNSTRSNTCVPDSNVQRSFKCLVTMRDWHESTSQSIDRRHMTDDV